MRKNTLRVSVVTVMIAGVIMTFGGFRPTASNPGTCPETKSCCEKKNQDALKNLNTETLSAGQFFTFAGMN